MRAGPQRSAPGVTRGRSFALCNDQVTRSPSDLPRSGPRERLLRLGNTEGPAGAQFYSMSKKRKRKACLKAGVPIYVS